MFVVKDSRDDIDGYYEDEKLIGCMLFGHWNKFN